MSSVRAESAPPAADEPEVATPPAKVWVGWALALAASLCFSVATPVARAAITSGIDSTGLLAVRLVLATVLLGATIAIINPRYLLSDRRCFLIATAAGLINASGMLGYFWALDRLEASMASMIIAVSPIAVLSLLALRGERVTYRHAVRLALALAGVYLLIGPGGQVDLVGVAWVMVAVASFAVQITVLQWYLMGYDARTVTFYLLLSMTVGVLCIWWLRGGIVPQMGVYGWTSALVLAVVSTYASRLLMFSAISHIGGGQVSMLSPVETLLTIIWAFLFLNERLTPIQGIGGLLILVSAVLAIQRLSIARLRPRWRLWAKS